MAKPYSGDLRARAIAIVEGGASRHEVAALFEVSPSTVIKWLQRWRDDGSYEMMRNYMTNAEFSYSALFMLFGSVLLTIGFLKRSAFLRWQALILIAATVVKVFLVDMSELGHGLRILSFIGLGILLLCVSYVYQRDWLNLRGQKAQDR